MKADQPQPMQTPFIPPLAKGDLSQKSVFFQQTFLEPAEEETWGDSAA